MGAPLSVLIVEDSEDDALLVLREIRRAGYEPAFERVETAEAMNYMLDVQTWDVVIADYIMPHFSGPAALELLKKRGLDLPFIVVSGNIGEDTAVEMMIAGAHDYIMKDNLARLVPAVERELREASVRRKRKQAEEKLRESEERYRTLAENTYGLIAEVSIDRRFLYLSPNYKDMLGYEPSELLGRGIFELMHPDDRAAAAAEFKRAVETFSAGQAVYRFRDKSGEWRWFESTGKPFQTAKGEIRGVIISRDITERKRAEEELRESNERYRTLTEHTYDLIAELSLDGQYLYLNPNHKDVLGYDPGELMDKVIFEFVHPDDFPAAMEEFERAKQTFSKIQAMVRFRHKNGEWRWLESTGKPFQTANGEIRRVIASRDITEKRKMEEELLKVQKLESTATLAGGIAHDFNNILMAILGNVSFAKMATSPEDEIFKTLTSVEKATLRAKELTQQLLTFSRGGTPIKKTASVSGIIKDTVDFALRGSNVRAEHCLSDDLWAVEMDEGQISRVINNLIINADQSMPEGGVIKIRAENMTVGAEHVFPLKGGKYIKISIEDNGVGIPEEYLPKIFDPYFTTKHKGSGLGLSVCYSIIKNHDGHIDVESKIGVGTTFRIYLPASQKEIPTKEDAKNITLTGKGKILVMDDEEDIRKLLRQWLLHFGYRVRVAKDGAEAIELYKKARDSGQPFDMVIMDLTVPGGMGGKEAIQKLIEIDPQVKAIVSSGYSDDPVVANFRQYGFSHCVTKPYKPRELVEILNSIIMGTNV